MPLHHIGVPPPNINPAHTFSAAPMTTANYDDLDMLERPARAHRDESGRATAAEFRMAWQGLQDSIIRSIVRSIIDTLTDPLIGKSHGSDHRSFEA
jgi:hypothetical protein